MSESTGPERHVRSSVLNSARIAPTMKEFATAFRTPFSSFAPHAWETRIDEPIVTPQAKPMRTKITSDARETAPSASLPRKRPAQKRSAMP